MQHDDAKRVQELQKKQVAPRTTALKQVPLFAHLPQYEKDTSLSAAAVAKGNIHPAVLRLGLQMAEGMISGSNARVVGMLRAFQHFIRDFDAPPGFVGAEFARGEHTPSIQGCPVMGERVIVGRYAGCPQVGGEDVVTRRIREQRRLD